MKLHPGRLLGIVMGIVILVGVFLLPFGDDTLYSSASSWLSDLSYVQSLGDSGAIVYAYVVIVAFILLVIAGLVGVFPLGTGVLGVVGMAMLTVVPLLLPDVDALTFGVGFFVIWAASITSLAGSFWHGKKEPTVSVVVQQAPQASMP